MDEIADMHRLLKRGETYYYHRRVPLHLVDIVGRKFVRLSLGTDSLKEARRRRALEDTRTEAMFREAEKGIRPGNGRVGVSLETVTTYMRETVEDMDRKASERLALSPPADKSKLAELVQDAEIQLGILTDPGDPRQDEYVSRVTDEIAHARGLDLSDDAFVAQFADVVRRGLVEATRRRIARLTNATDRAFYDVAFDPSAQPAPPASQASLDTDIVNSWAAERRPTQKAIDSCRSEARKFLAVIGPRAVGAITRADILHYKARMIEDGLTHPNIKTRLSRLNTLLSWAAENGHLPSNPAKGVTIKVSKKSKDKRQPFSADDLNAIFGGPVHAGGDRPTRGRGDAAYWLPLLALFTGARLEELAQLRPHDVARQTYAGNDGQCRKSWFITIVEVDGENSTSVKTARSERVVPVHPALEELGFVDFAKSQRDAGHVRIFHLLKPGAYARLGNKWGEWWSSYLRLTIGISDRRKVFHSFRHTFKDMTRHANLPEGIARQIMGHSGEDVADDYGNGYPLSSLVDAIAKVRPVGVKLPPPYATPTEVRSA